MRPETSTTCMVSTLLYLPSNYRFFSFSFRQFPFFYHSNSHVAYLLLYVDDIVLTASSTDFLQHIISLLQHEFSMTDLGSLHHFLGIAVTRDHKGLFLSQRQYSVELLNKAGMLDCQPSRTPVDTNSKLSSDGETFSDPTLYRSLTGALQYLTLTRLNYPMLYNKHVFLCMILVSHIIIMSNESFGMSKELSITVST